MNILTKHRRATTLTIAILTLVGLLTPMMVWSDGEREEWIVPERHARKVNPVAPNEESVARGKANFKRFCVPCHGEAGKGDGPAAPAMPVPPSNLSSPEMWKQTDGMLYWKILKGRPPMPAFAGVLKRAQRWDMVNYLRTLAPKPEDNQDN